MKRGRPVSPVLSFSSAKRLHFFIPSLARLWATPPEKDIFDKAEDGVEPSQNHGEAVYIINSEGVMIYRLRDMIYLLRKHDIFSLRSNMI